MTRCVLYFTRIFSFALLHTGQALDLLFSKMKGKGFPFGRVVGVSGCGQQHGSVYWREGSEAVLMNLDPNLTLAEQLKVQSHLNM